MQIGVIVVGILGLFGLAGITFMTFEKAEKVVESPAVQIGIIAAAIIALYLVYRTLKKA